eukprot:6208242-Pleurochrysis_carterae.AAC.1
MLEIPGAVSIALGYKATLSVLGCYGSASYPLPAKRSELRLHALPVRSWSGSVTEGSRLHK